jgi:hypothetical protein
MQPLRLSLFKMMAAVGVIAINLAAARAAYLANELLLVGLVPAAVALQFGLFVLLRSRGRVRAFWAGFLAFGSVAMLFFFLAMSHPRNVGIARTSHGKFVRIDTPGSSLWNVLEGYANFASHRIEQLPFVIHILESLEASGEMPVVGEVIPAVIYLLPQLLIALTGGFLALSIAKAMDRRSAAPLGRPAATPALLKDAQMPGVLVAPR